MTPETAPRLTVTLPSLSVQAVAELLGFTPETISKACKRGDLPAVKVLGRWRLREEDVLAWVQGQTLDETQGSEPLKMHSAGPSTAEPRSASHRASVSFSELARERRAS